MTTLPGSRSGLRGYYLLKPIVSTLSANSKLAPEGPRRAKGRSRIAGLVAIDADFTRQAVITIRRAPVRNQEAHDPFLDSHSAFPQPARYSS
jgi:hypothetical protein